MGMVSHQQDAQIPAVSTAYPRKYFEDAWTDLQVISKSFHPYNSHANDDVHDYILERVKDAVGDAGDGIVANVTDDTPRKIVFSQRPVFQPELDASGNVVYFEGNNVLVRIEGSVPSLSAVLITAHYDSVSTGYGTTDDGGGIAAMLGTLRYFIDMSVQPKRTVIFNFNNNEESGLLGAEAFMYHPWSEETKYFINLEGAGALGRPVLFRTTDFGVARHFAKSPNPHGSSVLQQGFQSGLVSSQTDYKVLADNGMRGLDIAFYKSRSLYHTRSDNIHSASLGGLSHMMSSAISVLSSMADANSFDQHPDDLQPAVFFDIFDTVFAVHALPTVIKWNIVGLVVGPVAVFLLFIWAIKGEAWDVGKRGWLRGVLAMVLSTGVGITSVIWLEATNPYVFVSNFYGPLFGTLGVIVLTNYVVLSVAWWSKPVHDQKLIVLLETFVLWWALLLYATVKASREQATGFFPFTILYYLQLVAILFGFLGLFVIKPWAVAHDDEGQDAPQSASSSIRSRQAVGDEESQQPENIDETTALLPQRQQRSSIAGAVKRSNSYDWVIQFLIVVPISLYCIYSTGLVVLDAMHQTPNEGICAVSFLCETIAVLSISIGLIILPFVHRLNSFVLLVILIGTIYSAWTSLVPFPYTKDAPMKAIFYQEIDLDTPDPEAFMKVHGTHGHVHNALKELPSVKSSSTNLTCEDMGDNQDLCSYRGLRPWVVGSANYSDWLQVETRPNESTVKGPNRGEVVITAPDTRHCSFEFNTTRFKSGQQNPRSAPPVRVVEIHHDTCSTAGWKQQGDTDIYTHPDGIEDFVMWKLDWDDPHYHVAFEWIPSWYDDDHGIGDRNERLGVTVTCYWAEYDQEIMVDGNLHRKVPAYDEILQYSPTWTSWSKWKQGLVQVKKYIEL
ncbi:hypothetical protein TRICI_000428 [Trichomonascus ciferrii]|uniref:Peptide hydrolase n=1 Tax=Trichomonascus ciferrii TaxID=44093 RepID=A0A642VDE6_9ASCO|nr:hypothetical protein TRICI_000428 [Trichomonascus ciferrii]